MREASVSDNFVLFFTIGECIEDRCYIFVCCQRRVRRTHSKLAYVSLVEWACTGDVVRKFRVPLQFPPIIEESIFSLNGVDI